MAAAPIAPPAAPLRAVFFDLGGTLFTNRAIPRLTTHVLVEAAERLGVHGGPADDDAALARVGLAYVRASRAANAGFVEKPYYLHRDLFHETYRGFAEELGALPSSDFLDWFYTAQRAALVDQIRLRRDCIETLEALRERGLLVSIVSNIDDDYLEPLIEQLQLAPHVDHWTSSEEAQSCKPDGAFFRYALRKAGCRAEEVFFVGDSRVHDIQGARRAGMTAILIAEEGGQSIFEVESVEAEPHHEIRQLLEIVALVDQRRATQ